MSIHLWKDLFEILNSAPGEAFSFLGDFNCVRDQSERLNCEYRLADSRLINSFIKNCNLLDIKPVSAPFTWFGNQGKKSRLDRFLINTE